MHVPLALIGGGSSTAIVAGTSAAFTRFAKVHHRQAFICSWLLGGAFCLGITHTVFLGRARIFGSLSFSRERGAFHALAISRSNDNDELPLPRG
uniref:Uncharacterized protein n=1 Tax=Anopheles darlingi TaxID=43151 RepID=A0A2M4D3I8_ANODA